MCPSEATNNPALISRKDFPDGFLFGSATSAFQVEGSRGNRGMSIWDTFAKTPGKILDGSTADVACDQYNRFKEDVDMMAEIGLKVYRFSISWPRLFLDGYGSVINQEGFEYYNNLIDYLLEKGITPFVTLFHWDLPQVLEETIGGWLSPDIPKYFAAYAEACFTAFGDRVKHWFTINEPFRFAVLGYSLGVHAPGRSSNRKRCLCGDSSVESYLVAHHALLAHATAAKIYRDKFKGKQGGRISIVVDTDWPEPYSSSLEDKQASQRHLEFTLGWFLDPIYYGRYPASMSEILGERLPQFTREQIALLQDSVDFIGLNHYSSFYVTSTTSGTKWGWFKDVATHDLHERDGKPIGDKGASFWLYIVPWGIKKVLSWITERYNRPPIYITENGVDDENDPAKGLSEFLHDKKRIKYYEDYLSCVSQAIREGADVRGYFAWSFLDNYEWSFGYTKRFGIVFVDHANKQKRYLKDSALWFKRLLTE